MENRREFEKWIAGAKTDLEAGLYALELTPESALLVDWAKAYGPKLVETAQRYETTIQLLSQVVAAWDEVRRVARGGESDVALITLMERTKMRMNEVHDFLRSVGRET